MNNFDKEMFPKINLHRHRQFNNSFYLKIQFEIFPCTYFIHLYFLNKEKNVHYLSINSQKQNHVTSNAQLRVRTWQDFVELIVVPSE